MAPQAGLLPNTVKQTISGQTLYSHPPELNQTLRDEMWGNMKYDRGLVFVDKETIQDLGLDETKTFPWDVSKGVYLVNAFHQIHCLVS